MPISITALASWCLFDNWIKDLPIDESVADDVQPWSRASIKYCAISGRTTILSSNAPEQTLGLSLEDTAVNDLMIPLTQKRKIPVRVYVFTRTAWTAKKLQAVDSMLSKL